MSAVINFSEFALTCGSTHELLSYLYTLPAVSSPISYRQILLFISEERSISDIISHNCKKNQINILSYNSSTYSFKLSRTYGNEKRVEGTITIIKSKRSGLYYLISVCDSNFWNYLVRFLIRHAYPQIKSLFYTQSEIKKALIIIKEKYSSSKDFRIRETTTKEKRENEFRFDTERRWTNLSIDQMFLQAKERNQLFISILIHVFKISESRKRKILTNVIKIYKNGEIFCSALDNNLVLYLTNFLENNVVERLALFKDRSLRDKPKEPSKPLEVVYDIDIFSKKEEFNRFRDLIKKYPNSNKSIFHLNPYFYVNLMDLLDGSSFDIWVIGPDRINFVPQAKSSQQSFEKIINYIFENFKEGRIQEMEL